MSEAALCHTVTDSVVEIRFPEQKRGLLSKLARASQPDVSFLSLPEDHQEILFAIGELRAWGDLHENEVIVSHDKIRASHDAVANLTTAAARALGLPNDVHLTLRTDVTGTVGRSDFRLAYEWSESGRRVMPRRQGAILHTADGPRRVPIWMKRALDLSDAFDPSRPIEDHWTVLAEFRRALEPEETPDTIPQNPEVANLAMTSFLRGLEVRIANQFSISPSGDLGDFEVIPYSSRSLEDNGVAADDVSEGDAELTGEPLAVFQYRLRQRGARPAYQLGNNSYLVVDKSSHPVLEEISRAQKAPREERKAFIRNPRAFITEAVNRHLEESGAFDGLDAADQNELIEKFSANTFVESREYSARVTGKIVYEKPSTPIEGSGTVWLPEIFSEAIAEAITEMPIDALASLRDQLAETLSSAADTSAQIAGEKVQVTPELLAAVDGVLTARREAELAVEQDNIDTSVEDARAGPTILDTLDNYEDLSWRANLSPRTTHANLDVPDHVLTELRPHQEESFRWAIDAWQSGLPGIINADEQGLGKTLQTITFLTWLQKHMHDSRAAHRGPIMVVAPTSLLRTWESEVEQHVAPRKFGHLVRLYGSFLGGQKQTGARGTETDSGLPLLNLEWLDEALEEGRAHRYWFLTTYTTLANYQHSLGAIPFSALVMDEIQNIKNKDTIASKAAEAMNADFRIGLTGTPIENTTLDLWTIMDRLCPGALGSGTEFRSRYNPPDTENMAELHARVFKPCANHPALGLRRLKDDVATDLPVKSRLMHPRLMPSAQSSKYDEARAKMASGGPGAALKMLHHIRSVSVHPSLYEVGEPDLFIKMSARLSAVMEILEGIKAANERALVFIENREMQFRFAELVRHLYGLSQVDVINGDTPIPRRQAIVERFQRHLKGDAQFDLLILGPKAAGTGLTLTAATHVIHLSRWWNPAVEEQCNDRVHRIGQTRPVTVHVPLAIHPGYKAQSFDCLLQSLMQNKRRMASQALWPMGDTRDDLAGLREGLDGQPQMDMQESRLNTGDIVRATMVELLHRDGLPAPEPDASGAYRLP